ncbi:CBS domain-containing protein [Candidatus Scalindua japonica]|uniref:CBS domain-containing protein n=1 Tax=Candidatus Scalindua japonica TaxID=1284222 RepID=UPI000BDEFD3D|nr:CBS domain-containing protein [Candidatus Scalindua japonica]
MIAKNIINRGVITVRENENLAQLMAKFHTYNNHTLPVTGQDNNILGIIKS